MKTFKAYLFLSCFLLAGTAIQAQALSEKYSGTMLPTVSGWQELRFDAGLLWEQDAKNLSANPASLSAVATTALHLQVSEHDKYSQLGWYKANTGFSSSIGFTVEFKAKVINASPGSFSVYGFDTEGKGFRLELSNSLLTEHSDITNIALSLSTADATDEFHTYRIAVAPTGKTFIWRDGVKIGEMPVQIVKRDNLIKDGGFESGATSETLGYKNDGLPGTTTISSDPGHVYSGNNGLFMDKGRHVYQPVPLKPGAEYNFSFWGKTISYPEEAWRDMNAWLHPANYQFMYGIMQNKYLDWLKYSAVQHAGGDVQRFTFESPASADFNNNQSAYDEFLLTEYIRPSRIPANAVNVIPNGDFENTTDPINNIAYKTGYSNEEPDWHPTWGARVRLQGGRQPVNNEAGIFFSRSGQYSLRYYTCGGVPEIAYGEDYSQYMTGNENRGANSPLNFTQELEPNKTYTFSFWYHTATWPDRMYLAVANGNQELWKELIVRNNFYTPYWVNQICTFTTTNENHTLKLYSIRDGHCVVYFDDLFLFEGEPLPEYDNTYLFFGKPMNTETVDVQIQEISYDNTGAYDPEGNVIASSWAMKQAPLMTEWSELINPNNVLPEYPRPQLERTHWVNLNGIWDFRKGHKSNLGIYPANESYRQQILVPYPVESAISGIMDTDYANNDKMYTYKRTFTVDPANSGKRIILNFGAVDWEAHVFVNGTKAGEHKGGYDPFSFDITDALKASGEQELVVQIYDPTKGGQPRGKQDRLPGGIWYTPSSGIWQTVWYEALDPTHITGLSLTPDVDNNSIKMKVNSSNTSGVTAEIVILDGVNPIKTETIEVGQEKSLVISSPKLWSPDSPFLYNVQIALKKNGVVVDEVKSYFGMRKIEVKKLRNKPYIFLNNQPIFHYGTLDQGFWPDGLHTAPTDAALLFDIEKTKALGMNMIRKHIKVEPARWYYHCDVLGMMVWQDMPTAAGLEYPRLGDDNWVKRVFLEESERIVSSLKNYPSIVVWVPYNEAWAQFDENADHTRNGVDLIRKLDNTRLINPVSGWTNFELGDIIDRHNYSEPALHDNPYNQRANVCGETGGYGWAIEGHMWSTANNPYTSINSAAALTEKFQLFNEMAYALTPHGINAIVYTQITDVEEEVNGFYTYDRKVYKLAGAPEAELKRGIQQMKTQTMLSFDIIPTKPTGYAMWKYTDGSSGYTIPSGWNTTMDYDDSKWKEGMSGFGTGEHARTQWTNQTIYLRKKFNPGSLTAEQIDNLKFRIFHDENFQVYINGVLAASGTGYLTNYKIFNISAAAKATLLPNQDNLIAVKCIQTFGGQLIDVGLSVISDVALDQELPVAPEPAFIEIRTVEEFDAIRNDMSGFYKLMNDIDLSSKTNFTPIGNFTNPFRGCIDGNGHVIKGLKINRNELLQGLFGYADGAYFTDMEINKPSVQGLLHVGALLGYGNGVTMKRIAVIEPSITSQDYSGGIIGSTYGDKSTLIQDCYVANGSVTADNMAGGVLAIANNTQIENTYFTGNIETSRNNFEDNGGGGIISFSYNPHNKLIGVASLAESITGGIVAEFAAIGWKPIETIQCHTYPNMKLSNNIGYGGLERATNEQLKLLTEFKQQATYLNMGWNFDNVWAIDEDKAYPVLQYTLNRVSAFKPVQTNMYNPLTIHHSGDNLILTAASPASVWIYNISGTLTDRLEVETSKNIQLPHGAYIVKSISNGEVKVEKILH